MRYGVLRFAFKGQIRRTMNLKCSLPAHHNEARIGRGRTMGCAYRTHTKLAHSGGVHTSGTTC